MQLHRMYRVIVAAGSGGGVDGGIGGCGCMMLRRQCCVPFLCELALLPVQLHDCGAAQLMMWHLLGVLLRSIVELLGSYY